MSERQNIFSGAPRSRGLVLRSLMVGLCGVFSLSRSFAEAPAGTTLSYEMASGIDESFPDSCGKPYQDAGQFLEFFEATLSALVVERGPRARGVVDLFAVLELRQEMKSLFPNLSEESPLDRLITAQLCQYQKVRQSELKPGQVHSVVIHSGDSVLHRHLIEIAPKLFEDARKLMSEGLAAQARLKSSKRRLSARRSDIRTARELGRAKVDDLFSSDSP